MAYTGGVGCYQETADSPQHVTDDEDHWENWGERNRLRVHRRTTRERRSLSGIELGCSSELRVRKIYCVPHVLCPPSSIIHQAAVIESGVSPAALAGRRTNGA